MCHGPVPYLCAESYLNPNASGRAGLSGPSLLRFKNGKEWKIQGNWSNAAFSAGTGFPNLSGQDGCIDGHG